MNTPLTFYDSDCISSFLRIDKSYLLKKLFSQIYVPKQVYDEITTPDSYWFVKKNAERLKREGFLKIIFIENNYKSLKDYNNMIKGKYGRPIGKGEAAALSLAISKKGIVASNNLKDVKQIAQRKKIPLITSSIILTALYENGMLSDDEIENIWLEMKKRNTKLPSESFKKYYDNLFKQDYAEFNLKGYYEKLIQ